MVEKELIDAVTNMLMNMMPTIVPQSFSQGSAGCTSNQPEKAEHKSNKWKIPEMKFKLSSMIKKEMQKS